MAGIPSEGNKFIAVFTSKFENTSGLSLTQASEFLSLAARREADKPIVAVEADGVYLEKLLEMCYKARKFNGSKQAPRAYFQSILGGFFKSLNLPEDEHPFPPEARWEDLDVWADEVRTGGGDTVVVGSWLKDYMSGAEEGTLSPADIEAIAHALFHTSSIADWKAEGSAGGAAGLAVVVETGVRTLMLAGYLIGSHQKRVAIADIQKALSDAVQCTMEEQSRLVLGVEDEDAVSPDDRLDFREGGDKLVSPDGAKRPSMSKGPRHFDSATGKPGDWGAQAFLACEASGPLGALWMTVTKNLNAVEVCQLLETYLFSQSQPVPNGDATEAAVALAVVRATQGRAVPARPAVGIVQAIVWQSAAEAAAVSGAGAGVQQQAPEEQRPFARAGGGDDFSVGDQMQLFAAAGRQGEVDALVDTITAAELQAVSDWGKLAGEKEKLEAILEGDRISQNLRAVFLGSDKGVFRRGAAMLGSMTAGVRRNIGVHLAKILVRDLASDPEMVVNFIKAPVAGKYPKGQSPEAILAALAKGELEDVWKAREHLLKFARANLPNVSEASLDEEVMTLMDRVVGIDPFSHKPKFSGAAQDYDNVSATELLRLKYKLRNAGAREAPTLVCPR